MTMTPQRILLFIAGLLGAGLGAAYYSGVFDQPAKQEIAQEQADAGSAAQKQDETAAVNDQLATPPVPVPAVGVLVKQTPKEAAPAVANETAPAVAQDVVVPAFDLLRVEPNGSLVVAGRASPNSSVEIVSGSSVLATAKAGANGDFAAVLDRALKPGEHTVVLRSTSSDNVAATSPETAIVSIPSSIDGEVVALVQQPGMPSRLITVPELKASESAAVTDGSVGISTGEADTSQAAPEQKNLEQNNGSAVVAEGDVKAKTGATQSAAPAEAQLSIPSQSVTETKDSLSEALLKQKAGSTPYIEAVEIDGRQVFVAGQSEPGKRVRVYVNDVLLGQAVVEPSGRFLIQTERDLPVGDYIIRVDILGEDGVTVTARAAVPFARQAGENMTSIAAAPAAQANSPAGAADTSSGENPALQRADGAVIIRKGDTLWHISLRVYGQGMRYTTIYQANKDQIRDPNLIWPGQTFSVPSSSNEGEAADLSTISEQSVPGAGVVEKN